MIEAITLVALAVTIVAISISIISLQRSAHAKDAILRVILFLFFGLVAASLDFMVELKGTTNNQWSYTKSILLIGGFVPIELPAMFFSFGVIMATAAITPMQLSKNEKMKTVSLSDLDLLRLSAFVFLFIIGITGYFLAGNITALVFAVPAGLFGYDVTPESDKRRAIFFGLFAMLCDIIFEIFVINLAGYDYVGGFSLDVPLEYFLLAVAGFGLANLTYYGLFVKRIPEKNS
ncbi:MAG: hypothetical protein ACXAEU_22110 [Candidatus Hodarchaeales archaeon]